MAKNIIRIIIPEHIKGFYKHYTYCHILEGESIPFYVGIGTQVKKSSKWSRACSKSGRNEDWKDYINNKKYYVVICTESDDYSKIKVQEIEVIDELGRKIDDQDNYLVNISKGGEGCTGYKHTLEHIQKLKDRYKGENNPMYGKKASKETRKKMSEAQRGRRHSEESKEKMRNSKLNIGYKGPVGENHHKARKVLQIDPLTKDVIACFNTLRLAASELNTTDKAIGRACRKGFKVKKFNWQYGN